jgi:hypothetical protein
MLLRLQAYDCNLEYLPGKEMVLPDTLSRAFLHADDSSQVEKELREIKVVDVISVSKELKERIRDETEKDETLRVIKGYIQAGWPQIKSEVDVNVTLFFAVKDELAESEGFVVKGDRIVIPETLRSVIRDRLHTAHQGMEACLRRARATVYWPGMTPEVKHMVSQCATCRALDTAQPK